MNENTLIILLFLYSVFEYLLRRLFWKSDKSILSAVLLFLILLVGSLGIENVVHVLSYVVLAVLYAFLVALPKNLYVKYPRASLQLYLAQQIIMFALLYTIARFVPFSDYNTSAFGPLLAPFERVARWWKHNYQIALLVSAAYLFLIDGGTQIVRNVLAKFPGTFERAMRSLGEKADKKNDHKENNDATTLEAKQEQENAGEWIGILERAIVVSFVFTSSFSAIAFALAAKSIARFKELEDKDFAEYYLLGTSASVGVAILVGLIVKVIAGF